MMEPNSFRDTQKWFNFLILLFVIMIAAQGLSGFWLFSLHYGFKPTDLHREFTTAMGWRTALEVAMPHTLAIALISFILGHFLLFVEGLTLRKRLFWGLGLLLASLLNTNIALLVLISPAQLFWLKACTFTLYQFFFITVCWVIFKSAAARSHAHLRKQ